MIPRMIPRRRFVMLSACAVGVAGVAALGVPAIRPDAPRHRWTGRALGADVALTVAGGSERAARAFFAESARALRAVETQFSLFRGSELSRLNAMGHLPHPSADLRAVLDLAGQVHAATGGAFDPTVQPLWQARRDGRDEAAARALSGWADVAVGEGEIRLMRPGMALTLNGIAQGFAADRLAEVAARHGLGEVLIDAGETRALGPRDWTARIEAPGGAPVRDLTLRERALATSAPYGTRIGPAGDRPHILSADAGRAPRWQVVSISAGSAALADALSTAAVLMDRPAIDRALAGFAGTRIEAIVPLRGPGEGKA